MADSKKDVALKDAVLIVRLPASTRERLYEIAQREGRTVSNVTLCFIEEGLERYERTGQLSPSRDARGAAFERAVVDVLIAYGLLSAAKAVADQQAEPDVVIADAGLELRAKQGAERQARHAQAKRQGKA